MRSSSIPSKPWDIQVSPPNCHAVPPTLVHLHHYHTYICSHHYYHNPLGTPIVFLDGESYAYSTGSALLIHKFAGDGESIPFVWSPTQVSER